MYKIKLLVFGLLLVVLLLKLYTSPFDSMSVVVGGGFVVGETIHIAV